jgi:hypothetical protein
VVEDPQAQPPASAEEGHPRIRSSFPPTKTEGEALGEEEQLRFRHQLVGEGAVQQNPTGACSKIVG